MKTKQAKINVVLPVVKIRIDDLSYLKGLVEAEENGKPKCIVPHGNESRLRILGLIEDVEIGPCPREIKEHKKATEVAIKTLKTATASEPWDWDALSKMDLWKVKRIPQPRKRTQPTLAGRALLADGEAKVVVQKSCR